MRHFTLKIPLAFVRTLEHNTVMGSRLARIELEEQIMKTTIYQGVRENAAKKLSNSKTRMEMSAIEAATMGATVPASSQIFNERGWLFTENGKHFWIERSSLTLATMDLENYEVLK
jgi:hypothetical protein